MRFLLYIMISLLGACSNIASKSLMSPDQNIRVSQGDYGEYPKTYNTVLKNYLTDNIVDIKQQK